MIASLKDIDLDSGIDQIPLKDVGRYVDASIAIRGEDPERKAGLTEVVESIRPPSGMFVIEDDKGPVASALCVHDNDLAGLFDIAVRADQRGKGYARSIVRAALRWAAAQGAQRAWLQVMSPTSRRSISTRGSASRPSTPTPIARRATDRPMSGSRRQAASAGCRLRVARHRQPHSAGAAAGGKVHGRPVGISRRKGRNRRNAEETLVRELAEELGIVTEEPCLAPLTFASHAYDAFHLLMPLYVCRKYQGIPVPREGQQLKWVRARRCATTRCRRRTFRSFRPFRTCCDLPLRQRVVVNQSFITKCDVK
jgi:GNAT superfamily N-acetyltransferase/8-oxo-dGTP pyrophosphatase MutT (NUDIX family)